MPEEFRLSTREWRNTREERDKVAEAMRVKARATGDQLAGKNGEKRDETPSVDKAA